MLTTCVFLDDVLQHVFLRPWCSEGNWLPETRKFCGGLRKLLENGAI